MWRPGRLDSGESFRLELMPGRKQGDDAEGAGQRVQAAQIGLLDEALGEQIDILVLMLRVFRMMMILVAVLMLDVQAGRGLLSVETQVHVDAAQPHAEHRERDDPDERVHGSGDPHAASMPKGLMILTGHGRIARPTSARKPLGRYRRSGWQLASLTSPRYPGEGVSEALLSLRQATAAALPFDAAAMTASATFFGTGS